MLLNDHHPSPMSNQSQLFTVRVWVETAQDGGAQLRVQVKHVLSGAIRTFREWSQVIAFIEGRLQGNQEDGPAETDK